MPKIREWTGLSQLIDQRCLNWPQTIMKFKLSLYGWWAVWHSINRWIWKKPPSLSAKEWEKIQSTYTIWLTDKGFQISHGWKSTRGWGVFTGYNLHCEIYPGTKRETMKMIRNTAARVTIFTTYDAKALLGVGQSDNPGFAHTLLAAYIKPGVFYSVFLSKVVIPA